MPFGFVEKDVQVGVNLKMDPALSHGAAKVMDNAGQINSVFFQVDHPNRLRNPTNDQVRDIFKQFNMLGMQPSSIIIATGVRTSKIFRSNGMAV